MDGLRVLPLIKVADRHDHASLDLRRRDPRNQSQRYDLAAKAAYRAVQCNPGHSISYMLLAAALVKLDRTEEAKVAAVRVIELQPGFRYLRQLAGVGCAPDLAVTLGEASDAAGLPG